MRVWLGLSVMMAVTMAAGAGSASVAKGDGLEGNWRTPTGSVVKAYHCGDAVCLKLMQIEKTAPGTEDRNNPDAKLRSRSLCGLDMGTGFKPDGGGSKAEGGSLYDPKSGKTYTGALAADGDVLHLRGYIGFKVFGRSEDWSRVRGPVDSCRAS